MKHLIPTILFLFTFSAPLSFVRGQEDTPPKEERNKAVLFILQGQLSETMKFTLQRTIRAAESNGAKILIVEIDTPGGEMELMENLRYMLFNAHQKDGLETIAYINNNADSAGALIAMACRQIYMSPLAHIGSATPVTINPLAPLTPLLPPGTGQEDMTKKIKARVRAVFRATAIETDRNSDLAEAMVDADIELLMVTVDGEERIMTRQKFLDEQHRLGKNKVAEMSTICPKGELLNMTAREAMDWGFIEGIPESREELLEEFLEINTDDLLIVKQSWSEILADQIESIHILLLIVGLILLYVEYQLPGFGLPGILGLSCLALMFFGKYMAGLAEFTEILMVIIGLGLVAVEIFVIPGTYVAGIAGALLVGAGIILSFQPFILPATSFEADMLKENVLYLSGSVIVVLISAAVLSRFLPKNPIFGKLALEPSSPPGTLHGSAGTIDDVSPELDLAVGDVGVAKSMLRPAGKVLVRGVLVDAQTEGGFVDAGEDVEVIRITGNFIFVRKAKEPGP